MALAECADDIGDRYAELADASNRIETALEDTNLTTVMGTGITAGTASLDQIQHTIASTNALNSLIEAQEPAARAGFKSAIAELGVAISRHAATTAINNAKQQLKTNICAPIATNISTQRQAANLIAATGLQVKTISQADMAGSSVRLLEVRKDYLAVTARLKTIYDSIANLKALLKDAKDECDSAASDAALDITQRAENAAKIEGLMKLYKTQIQEKFDLAHNLVSTSSGHSTTTLAYGSLSDTLVEDNNSRRAVKDLIALEIPKRLKEDYQGLEFSVNFEAYLRGREDAYGTNMPEINRITRDIDPTTGLFWIPPSLSDGYSGIAESYREYYSRGSAQIYHLLMKNLPATIKTQLKMTHKVGLDLKTEIKCTENDGVTAYYVLMQLYHKQDESMRKRLEKCFEDAHMHFTTGDPLRKVSFLQDKLLEVQRYGIKLKWDKTGEPIVVTLERMDHAWARKLAEYSKEKITNKEDCAGHIDSLLADIVKGKKEIDRADKIIGTNTRAANPRAKALSAQGKGSKGKGKGGDKGKGKGKGKGKHHGTKCHFGRHCTRPNCPFEHPKHHTHCQEIKCKEPTNDGHRFCKTCNDRGYKEGSLAIKPNGEVVHFRGAYQAHMKREREDKPSAFGLESLTSDQQVGIKRAFRAAVERKVEERMRVESPGQSPAKQACGPRSFQALSARVDRIQESIDNGTCNSTNTSNFDAFFESE